MILASRIFNLMFPQWNICIYIHSGKKEEMFHGVWVWKRARSAWLGGEASCVPSSGNMAVWGHWPQVLSYYHFFRVWGQRGYKIQQAWRQGEVRKGHASHVTLNLSLLMCKMEPQMSTSMGHREDAIMPVCCRHSISEAPLSPLGSKVII